MPEHPLMSQIPIILWLIVFVFEFKRERGGCSKTLSCALNL